MDIEFKISRDELINFNMKYIVNTKIYKKQIRAYVGLVSFILLGLILLLRSILYTETIIIMYIIFFFSRKKIFDRSLRRKLLKIYGTDKLTDTFEATHLKIMEKGIKTNTKFSEKVHNWNSIKGLYLLEEYIFIPTMNGESLVIPLWSLSSMEDKKLFLDTIINNTNLELKYSYPDSV
ncbi:YcxB family protein [Clostridium beijerinckii]|uniref:YcxB family protein n=1 Tax=Clostridium beijerinckii TaxID=1520 RepID=UPI00222751D0|nr:YcxB family protein [Clostridium beijerinckii]UYZ33640.1 YcxB family protein [Clostridium beijerinckii]